ncbi:MAG: flagellar hook capping FlgD N-terminal domain-containing protein [Terracidiphilus sp.]
MAAMAGLFNHALTATQSLAEGGAAPAASSSDGSDTSDTATISANDFLTLLVTEMQNQDPTADTDPNEYINQLVQVNSLEQLISINQTLTTDLGSTGTTPSTGSASGPPASTGTTGQSASAASGTRAGRAGTASSSAEAQVPAAAAAGSSTFAALEHFAELAKAKKTEGNLGIPTDDPAAHRVARALDGHARAPTAAVKMP